MNPRFVLFKVNHILGESRVETIIHMIQYCIYPRCSFSPVDAVFCAKFILLMHNISTLNFASLFTFDKLFSKETVHATIFSCTETEAKNYGAFLGELLKILARWHKSESSYEKECTFVLGFSRKWPPVLSPGRSDMLTWDEFRKFLYKINAQLVKVITVFFICV